MPSERLTSHVRLTPGLKKRLKVSAAENGRSLNEEIVLRLEGSFDLNQEQRRRLRALATELLAEIEGRKQG